MSDILFAVALVLLIPFFFMMRKAYSTIKALILLTLILTIPFWDVPFAGYIFNKYAVPSCGERIYRSVKAKGFLFSGKGQIWSSQFAPIINGQFEFIETYGASLGMNGRQKLGYYTHRVALQGDESCVRLSRIESANIHKYLGLSTDKCIAVSYSETPISRYAYHRHELSNEYLKKGMYRALKKYVHIKDLHTDETIAEFTEFYMPSWLKENTYIWGKMFGSKWRCDGQPNKFYELREKTISPVKT